MKIFYFSFLSLFLINFFFLTTWKILSIKHSFFSIEVSQVNLKNSLINIYMQNIDEKNSRSNWNKIEFPAALDFKTQHEEEKKRLISIQSEVRPVEKAKGNFVLADEIKTQSAMSWGLKRLSCFVEYVRVMSGFCSYTMFVLVHC